MCSSDLVTAEVKTRAIDSGGIWVSTIRDLTEQKLQERELRDSEERLRLAQEAGSVGYFDWDLATGRTIWSESLRKFMIGSLEPATSLLDRLPVVHPEDRALYQTAIDDAVSGKVTTVSFNYRCTGPGEKLCWRMCEGRVQLSPNRKPIRIVGVIADITAHKHAEEIRLVEKERTRLESIIRSMTVPLIVFDGSGNCLSMNPAALSLHGLYSQPAGWSLHDFADLMEVTHLDGTPVPTSEWPLVAALKGRTVTGLELLARNRKAGPQFMASCGAAPIFDDAGKVAMAVVSLHDITAERAAADQATRANAALHDLSGQLLRLQDEERMRIARELHDGGLQRITAVAMNLLLIARSPAVMADPETQRLIVETQELARDSSRELRTISYLLHPPDLAEFGLAAALRSWADGFSQRTGINLDMEIEDPGRLQSDGETAIFRIAQEALANVHRHSGSATAQLLLRVSGREICLEIRDGGRGITEQMLQQHPERMGVGILGMRERARQLGGVLEILTSPSGGTTVRAVFPRSRAV